MRCPRCGGYSEWEVVWTRRCGRGLFLHCFICGEHVSAPRLKVIIRAAELVDHVFQRYPCSVKGCPENVSKKMGLNPHGFCRKHWLQWSNHRTGRGSIQPPLVQMESGDWLESELVQRRARAGSGRTRPSNPKRPCPICGRYKTIVNRQGPHGGTCDRCRRHGLRATSTT